MSADVVKFNKFYYAYPNSDLVLKNIELTIKPGSFTVLMGPSGAGKTTLCKAMAGIVPYYYGGRYAGTVEVLGQDTKGKRVSDIAMHLGLMLEDYESQLVSLTAGEEVAFALLNHGFPPEEVEARTRKALEDVGLPGRENYQLDELSGGQRQRLLLASVLAVQPKVLVLDEPVSAMDPEGAASLYKLVNSLYQKYQMTVVVVEHNLNYVLPYATDLVALKDGEVIAADSFEQAALRAYDENCLQCLLPEIWQVKLCLQKRDGVSLGIWRTTDDAIAELKAVYGRANDND
ncbi:MAG TPA: ABC transporter ATP-binding protein [Candidatus Avacidaminococcus intestinavium]|uniref:ABC transporter ATP-binding protein n=1 Tax=Candidatus Avacidaminococcus intestinavium TaxID=2840684 RepID=A0A9D1MPT3_9FIRM|nr:ABC transporter ATP-binding protein [Candidatus Avacidaminococcus intestinavium]